MCYGIVGNAVLEDKIADEYENKTKYKNIDVNVIINSLFCFDDLLHQVFCGSGGGYVSISVKEQNDEYQGERIRNIVAVVHDKVEQGMVYLSDHFRIGGAVEKLIDQVNHNKLDDTDNKYPHHYRGGFFMNHSSDFLL